MGQSLAKGYHVYMQIPRHFCKHRPSKLQDPRAGLQRESQVWVTEANVTKSQGCASSVASVVSHSLRPVDWSPLDSSAHGILQARIWSGLPCPLPADLPNPGIKPMSPVYTALHANSLPTELPGKPRSQGMDVWRKEDTTGSGQSWQSASRSAAITESGIRMHATYHKNFLKTVTLYNKALTRHLNVAWTPKFLTKHNNHCVVFHCFQSLPHSFLIIN